MSSPVPEYIYKVPPIEASEDTKKEWFLRTLDEGENFLRTQFAYDKIGGATSIIMGEPDSPDLKDLSRAQVNFQKRLIHDICATLSNTRPIQGFQASNRKYDNHADILNKLSINWYHNKSVDRKIRKCLQWASVSTGYLCPIWKAGCGYNQGDIELEVKGPMDVMPIQLPASMDLQEAYAVIIKNETPVHLAHSIWGVPEAIQADYATPTWYRGMVDKFFRFASPFFKSIDSTGHDPRYATVDIFHVYIMDESVNESGEVRRMGNFDDDDRALNSWSYKVPYVGMPIPTGTRVETGEFNIDGSPRMVDATRPATKEDCYLYPQRRLIIATRYGILYDGPSFWWHSRVPCVKVSLDDWPWQYLGMPLTWEGSQINKAYNEIIRAVIDTLNVSLDPPMGFPEGVVAETNAHKIHLRARGQRLKYNPQYGGQLFKTLVDADYYQISPAIPGVLEKLQVLQEYLLDVDNLKALAKNRQAPASDTVEAFNNLAGAITTDRSRIVEAAVEQLGPMIGSLFFQFYGAGRRIKTLGPNGVVKEDFDYEPGNMTPAPKPSDFDSNSVRRARWFQATFAFYIEHGSLHDITSMTQRLTEIQLKRSGAPMSWHTVMSHSNIQNVGALVGADGKEPVTENDKWEAEQKWMAKVLMEIQQAAQPMMGGGANDPMAALQGIVQAVLQASGGNQGNDTVGRKPSGQTAPHMIARNDGSSTIAESR